MKVCSAQFQPKAGDIDANISKHIELIELAARHDIDLVVFPELSITGYEPTLAKSMAMTKEDKKVNIFQLLSNKLNITIGAGLPLIEDSQIFISLIFFQPNKDLIVYSKQLLHEDELPFFHSGNEQILIEIDDAKIAPAICFESLQESHTKNAVNKGADVYMASVAKHNAGLARAYEYYSEISKKFSLNVILANPYGKCDNFIAGGSSGVWNKRGENIGQLGEKDEGLIGIDTESQQLLEYRF